MNIFFEEHRLVLNQLIDEKVEFILIGGYAVNFYGYNRTTGDMDIWLKPTNNNKLILLNVLINLGYDKEGVKIIESWDFNEPQKFRIGDENQPDKTEFMTHISGLNYNEAEKNRVMVEIEGIVLPMIHYNNLVQNKKSTGRLKDLADIEELEKIMHLKGK